MMTCKRGLYRWKLLSNRLSTCWSVNLDWRPQRLSRSWETAFHPFLLPTQWSSAFPARGTSFVEDNVSTHWGSAWGDGFGTTQAQYVYGALYFYYYYISSTSGHLALDPRGWGPLQGGQPQSRSSQVRPGMTGPNHSRLYPSGHVRSHAADPERQPT